MTSKAGLEAKKQDRAGYRGWLLQNIHTDGVVRIWASPFAAAKLADYPNPMCWPRIGDFVGAKAVIDAVMDRDIVACERLGSQFPEYDLGFGEWGKTLKAEYVKASALNRKVLRSKTFANGRTLTLECVTDSDTGKRSIRSAFYRGRTRLAEKTVVSE